MRKKTSAKFFIYLMALVLVLQSCKDDSYLDKQLPIPDQSFVEQFDTLTSAQARGWVIKNRSQPIGTGVWSQGPANSAYSSQSTNDGCIISDASACHDSVTFGGTISNWVMSPVITLQNNDIIIFYTETQDGTWGDRLQVRVNINNTGTECGYGSGYGDFTGLLLDINPRNASNDSANIYGIPSPPYLYDAANSYPTSWTRFVATIQGLTNPSQGRFAFRHYVPFGGDNGMGFSVLLDSVAYVSVNHHE